MYDVGARGGSVVVVVGWLVGVWLVVVVVRGGGGKGLGGSLSRRKESRWSEMGERRGEMGEGRGEMGDGRWEIDVLVI